MNIFKKRNIETSNDYYEAYKAGLGGKVEKKGIFTLNNILKLEILVVAVGLFIMNQNGLSLELKKMYVSTNDILPVSMQYASLDRDLVVEAEEVHVEKIKIREADRTNMLTTNILEEKDVYVENEEMKLLIELLKSEINKKSELKSSNRIIISQK